MQIKRRSVAFLLIFAMLTVSVVSLLPVATAADPVGDYAGDIQDFGWQSLSDANQTDAATDLRFLFTIGSLDYDEVGFVFSTSNSAPTAGGSGTYSTETVHSSVTANGKTYSAGAGRFWVAVKLSTIPLANFEDAIYVRPFVKVGENYSYVDAATITVCEALTFDKTVAGESEIFDFSNPSSGTEYSYEYNKFTVSKTIADIRGDQHFFKTSDEDDWKELYFEYSILWNPTLANTAEARMSVASFKDCELFGFYTRDDNDWHEYGGHFDMNKTFVYGSAGMDGNILLWEGNLQRSKRCGNRLRLVFQRLRELIGHHLTDALNVVTEQKAVLLIVFVAQLRHIKVHDGIALTEIYYLHINKCFKFGCKDTKKRENICILSEENKKIFVPLQPE